MIPTNAPLDNPPPQSNSNPSSSDPDKASQLFNCANSILEGCKDTAPFSHLDIAIHLFRQVLEQRPAAHPLRADSLKDLARALSTRFSFTKQHEDLEQAILLRVEIVQQVQGMSAEGPLQNNKFSSAEYDNMCAAGWDNATVSKLSELAKTVLSNFKQSFELSNIDTAIKLHREAILCRPRPHPQRLASLDSLAAAMYTRYCRTEEIPNLDEAISLLREAVESCLEPCAYRIKLLNGLAAALATRFDMSGNLLYLHEAMERHSDALGIDDTAIGDDDEEETSELLGFATDLLEKFKHTGQITDLETAISLFRQGIAQLPADHPNQLPAYHNLATALAAKFEESGQRDDLNGAISYHRKTLELLPTLHPNQFGSMNDLANALKTRFQQSGQREDLDEAILLYREALKLQPAASSDRSVYLNNLANTLMTRFKQLGQREDLDEAASFHREALQLLPAHHPNRSSYLNNLADALSSRFKQSGQREDLDEAISFHQDALKLRPSPHPDRPSSLNNLANTLKTQFEQLGQQEVLRQAISFCREAIELSPAPHPNRSIFLDSLATVLTVHFRQSGQQENLDEAISFHREALELIHAHHPNQFNYLNNLANALCARFEQSGQQDDLDEAILFHREALRLRPAPHLNRAHSINNLANALSILFERSGQWEDLDEAISFHREALELRPAPHPNRSGSLNNLANALCLRFEQSGQRDDLDEAISFDRESLELRPAPHPNRSDSLNNLATALWRRFEQSGQCEDLDEAVLFHQEALELRPAPHPDRSASLNNFASVLKIRFEESGQQADLEQAVSFHRQALELLPAPHLYRCISLNNLADALSTRFELSGQQEDLDEAVSFHQEALQLLPAHHPGRSLSLHNLGALLKTRFQKLGQWEDLEMALESYYGSLKPLIGGHPDICTISRNLGKALVVAYTHTDERQYLDKAVTAFQAAVMCEAAPASKRFRAAKSWAHHTDFNHEFAMVAYQAAIELLPRVAMLGLDLQSRQRALTSGSDGLARNAAACAIRSGQYDRAVELLEEGRAVFWSQALQLRTPLTDLRDAAPELEQKLTCISLKLEQGSLRDVSRSLPYSPQRVLSIEKEATHFRHLNNEWLATLEEVRKLDGFRDFLYPSRLSTLQSASVNGPVVVLNISEPGCFALILTTIGVQHVPLLNVSLTEVTKLVKLIRHAIAQSGRDAVLPEANRAEVKNIVQQMPCISETLQMLRNPLERHGGRASDTSVQPDDIFRYVLCVLWEAVVEPVIRSVGFEKSQSPARLWWCPTGPFTFLPIHAAGIYLAERTECASDYIVSSYTPTISSLISDLSRPTDTFKMMVTIQPDTPGQKSLPHTFDELRKIEDHVHADYLVKSVDGSVKEVLSDLQEISFAHFACHGQQNTKKPLESALLFHDGQLKVSQIMQQPMPNASLAFLSACETAMGDENLPDEVIHLGATLLFAGFRGVVATMWSIFDIDGPKIADSFYENLFKEHTLSSSSGPDITQAARALHVAVAKLRSENASFIRWVPFIHLGR